MVEPGIHPPPTPTTPRLAPWDAVQELCNKLDRLIALLEAWAPTAPPPVPPVEWPGWEPVISKLDEIKVQLGELKIKITAPWVAKEPEEIFRQAIRSADTFYSDKMVNWTEGKRLLLKVDSSLNQAVQIQAIGNINSARDGAVDINGPLPCIANGKITIGLAWDDWHPYVGCEITVAVAPTTGTLTISAVIQE
ncbi:hypothetical protein ES703_54333 [subsurface metagenome]